MRLIWIVASAAMAYAATNDVDAVLQRATAKVKASVNSIPNYTCVQTITRNYLEPPVRLIPRACPVLMEQRKHPTPDMVLQPASQDRLRLDVTMTRSGEMYSWVGASHFEAPGRGIEGIVRFGPISTGTFAGFLAAVFEHPSGLTFTGRKTAGDRELLEFSFRIPRADRVSSVKVRDTWVIIGFEGSIDIDPVTADVVSMNVVTPRLPVDSRLCLTTSALEFMKVRMGDGQFLLPLKATSHFVYSNAEEVTSTVNYSTCSEFRGESTLYFGRYPSPADEAPAAVSRAVDPFLAAYGSRWRSPTPSRRLRRRPATLSTRL